jgi:two-component system, OmpR family, KDP operon response regulator KdpE
MTLTVLLVEDDKELRLTLREALGVEGHRVIASASLADARAVLRSSEIDVILLDLGLPDGDGEALVKDVRLTRNVPILIISAKLDYGQKVKLLDLGADDYLTKPFSIIELLARMRVALRHRGTRIDAAITVFSHTGLIVDLAAHTVRLNQESVHLTPTEFKLLARLVRSAGQVVTHRQLLSDVWGVEFIEHTQYLRLYMGQLRAKLEVNSANPKRILTEPGIGYRLAEG